MLYKRILDIILLIILLPIFIMLHFIIFFLIKLDSEGEVIFKQKRVGQNKKPFVLYKYRTMYKNGDKILREYLDKHPEEVEYYNKYHKYNNDPRVTRIGKFLRTTSLDELPQIINILKNEMSFIGPRPYLIDELKKIKKEDQAIIFKVKPGITGLWQVSGRNNLSFKERISLDKYYVQNYNLKMDLMILIKTIKVIIFKIGAK